MKKIIIKLLVATMATMTMMAGIASVSAASDDFDQEVNLSVDDSISITGDASVTFTSALTANGDAVTKDGNLSVITNSDGGFYVKAERDTSRSTTLEHTSASATFPEATVWDSSANSGNGNASSNPGSTFAFRVKETGTYSNVFDSTWWGADTAKKYAGVPNNGASNNTIAETTTAQDGTSRAIVIEYYAKAPAGQTSGNYQGTITYTATTQ